MNVGTALLNIAECLSLTRDLWVSQRGMTDFCFVGALPGEITVMDYCGPESCQDERCGMAWVRLTDVSPQAIELPTNARGESCYGTANVARFEVGVVRCATAIVEEHGSLPTEDDQLADVIGQMEGYAFIQDVVYCCASRDKAMSLSFEMYTPYGPDGMCVGGVVSVTMDVD